MNNPLEHSDRPSVSSSAGGQLGRAEPARYRRNGTEWTLDELVADLRALPLRRGHDLLVHSSLRRVGAVQGGAATVVRALSEVIGPDGALVVPAFTQGNSTTSREHLEKVAGLGPEEYSRFLDEMPAFDPHRTPSSRMGVLSEQVRMTASAVRSGHPQTSFTALGAGVDAMMADHDPACRFGESSPLAKLYAADADILLIGVGFDRCTAFHLAEYRYRPRPPTRTYRCKINVDGRAAWWEYQDIVFDDHGFDGLGDSLERQTDAVLLGEFGGARVRRVSLRRAVDFAVEWLKTARNSEPHSVR